METAGTPVMVHVGEIPQNVISKDTDDENSIG
jgi:hypothetical protein